MINTKKNILILGGGISGMSAAIIAKNNFPESNVKLISVKLGGDFLKGGGLKYIHDTPDVWRFMKELGVDKIAGVRKVVGACLLDNESDEMVSYPDYFWFKKGTNSEDMLWNMQKRYWRKTRGTTVMENDCMNAPNLYSGKTAVDIDIYGLIMVMMTTIYEIGVVVDLKDVSLEKLRDIVAEVLSGKYDYVFYTLPMGLLFRLLMNVPFTSNCADLFVYKFLIPEAIEDKILWEYGCAPPSNCLGKIWWEYMYVPQEEYIFHRISIKHSNYTKPCNKQITIELECNFELENQLLLICNQFNELNKKLFKIPNVEMIPDELVFEKTKGQLISRGSDNLGLFGKRIPKNLFLLGRFAQWQPRMTFDRVLTRVYNIFDL